MIRTFDLILDFSKETHPYAVFRLKRATEVLELTYQGKYFACVNAN